MSEPWEPLARHGDSADEVRAALQEATADALIAWRAEQRAAGLPLAVIDAMARLQEKLAASRLDVMVESVMHAMAISAGAIGLH